MGMWPRHLPLSSNCYPAPMKNKKFNKRDKNSKREPSADSAEFYQASYRKFKQKVTDLLWTSHGGNGFLAGTRRYWR
jgi:hypothetical protein